MNEWMDGSNKQSSRIIIWKISLLDIINSLLSLFIVPFFFLLFLLRFPLYLSDLIDFDSDSVSIGTLVNIEKKMGTIRLGKKKLHHHREEEEVRSLN